jgi:hypothetical protein
MSETRTQEDLKRLREERKVFIERAKGLIKEQSGTMKKIKEYLSGEGATIPEIAEKTGMPTSEVLWFVMALKKYGQVIEGPKEEDYFKYQLAAPQGAA